MGFYRGVFEAKIIEFNIQIALCCMNKSTIFIIFSISFLSGIALASFYSVNIFYFYLLILLSLIGAIMTWQKTKWRILLITPFFIFLGIIRFQISEPQINENHIAFYNGREMTLRGQVIDEPRLRLKKQQIIVEAIGVARLAAGETRARDRQQARVFSAEKSRYSERLRLAGRILITLPLYPEFHYGDFLEISCSLQTPEKFDAFDYGKYLAKDNIYSVCYYPKEISLLESQETKSRTNFLFTDHGQSDSHGEGGFNASQIIISIKKSIFKIKSYFISKINQILPEPQASFLVGLLLGGRSSLLPDDLKDAFNRTSTTHIIAISGYNIAIILTIITKIAPFIYISRKKIFYIFLPAVLVFVILTGGEASVIRACIFGLLAAAAFSIGRVRQMSNALAFSAVIMVLIKPKILIFDLGFQLSFLAVIGLIYLSPILEILLSKEREKSGIVLTYFREKFIWSENIIKIFKESFFTTLSAIIFTTPLIIYIFRRFSLVGVVANIVILWIIPICMLLGFIAAILAVIYLPIGKLFALSALFSLNYVIWVIEKLSAWQYASVEITGFPWWGMAMSYIVLGAVIIVFYKKLEPQMQKVK